MKDATRILLDTHIWVWFMEGDHERLSKKSIELFQAKEKTGELLVSDISFWEVANKSTKARLFSIDTVIWLGRARAGPGVTYLPVERTALIQSARLSGNPPGDSVDRILIATALVESAMLVTSDANIIDYARDNRALSVYDARN